MSFISNLLKFVNADINQVVRLTLLASLVRIISYNCMILLVADIGVPRGCEDEKEFFKKGNLPRV